MGQPSSPLHPLNRLIWLKNNEPEIFGKTRKFRCWEGFILLKFGSEPATDYSVAGGTLAFDIKGKN
ncbi:MAG: FGGY family carbohydrate kinase [Armatimonadota bacterium]